MLEEKSIGALTLAVVSGLVGLTLLIGGFQLILLGGSWYYALAGAGLMACTWYLWRGETLAVWIYLGLFAATLIWSAWEAGGDFWAWIPRFVSPLVLLLAFLAVAPSLRPRTIGWRAAGGGAVAAVLVTLIGGALLYNSPPSVFNGSVPGPDGPEPERVEWLSYGGPAGEAQRFSSLDQITPDNVSQLQQVWLAHTGDMPGDSKFNAYGAETTPLQVGERLYMCSATNIMIALDAATGEEIWRHDPGVDLEWVPYTAACRGVVYYDAGTSGACSTRIIEGTLDGRVVSVDAETGEPCSGFGEGGEVDIKEGMGEVVPGMVSISSPPTLVDGVIVTGHQVLDGQKLDAPSGVIKGFDAETGELLWAWDMTNPDWSGLPPEGETYTRGTPNMWTTATGDDELGLVFLPMGNSAGDYWSGSRTEAENEYSTSLVALDVNTGEPAWHFQTVRKDVWDYDLGSQATLIDFPSGDGTVPAVLLASKQGDIYILDRATGQPLTPVEERPVPQGGVEPEERAETQPFSQYHTLARPALKPKDMWGMSLIDQMICRIGFQKAAYDGIYTPPTSDTRWIEYPGYNGGSDWGSLAVDPTRGVIVANYNDMPNYNRLVPRAEADARGWAPRTEDGETVAKAEGAGDPQAGAPYAIDVNAGWRMPFTGLLCKEPPYGGIRAIDLETGEPLGDPAIGSARLNGPFGIPSGLPLTIGTPNNGGPVVTAGGLIFLAATTDNLIRAIDIETGETVWTDTLPAGGQATPMTYEVDGRQYVVLMTGGHHFMETKIGDQVIAWALPEE